FSPKSNRQEYMNIIVPIDFSVISLNAARFAASMLNGQYDTNLVLYHVYSNAKEENDVKLDLEKIKESLLNEHIVKIECMAEEGGDFIDCFERKVRHLDAALVVMAITDKSRLEQVFAGSNSLRMIELGLCPVLVVPEHAKYNKFNNVALASDFKDVQNTIPIVPVKKVLNLFNPNLHIVNINSEIYVSLSEEYLDQRRQMLEMFQDFKPEFYFITTYDFHETLRQFITDK